MSQNHFDLLVTLDHRYLHPLAVMLTSLRRAHPFDSFDVYILHKNLSEAHIVSLQDVLHDEFMTFHPIAVDDSALFAAPTSKRYPKAIYYRLFASQYLPKTLDRILYLDPDIIVQNPIDFLYDLPFEGAYYIGASHLFKSLQRLNEIRLKLAKNSPYLNTGVLLINLAELRLHLDPLAIIAFIEKKRAKLMLPDQDILSTLYGDKIRVVDSLVFNLSDRYLRIYNRHAEKSGQPTFQLDWVRKHTVFVHYCGRNKPWKEEYVGTLGVLYWEAESYLGRAR